MAGNLIIAERLARAIHALPSDVEREVVTLHLLDGKSLREIAVLMQVSPGTVEFVYKLPTLKS